jgi:hypothetical protein
MAKPKTDLCQELADALKVWDKMNNDLEAGRENVTKAQHTLQRMKIDSLVRELEASNG